MWTPKVISIINFRSFSEAVFSFNNGAFLVQGVNETDSGQKSNGSGKSAFKEALCYALDLPVNAERQTDLINYNAKECEVIFELENKTDTLTIHRKTPLKGSSSLKLYLNGEDLGDRFATVPEGNKLIIELIGISKEDLLNHYIISNEKYTSILSTADTKVKALIGRFSNFNMIDGVEEDVLFDVGQLKTKQVTIQSSKDRLIGKLDVLKEQLEQEQSLDTDKVREAIIIDFNESIRKHQANIEEQQTYIERHKATIKNLEDSNIKLSGDCKAIQQKYDSIEEVNHDAGISEIETSKNDCINTKLSVNKTMEELNKSLRSFTDFKTEVELSISGAIKCPECFHEFVVGQEIDVKEARETLPEVQKEIEGINEKLNLYASKISEIDSNIYELNKKLDIYQKNIDNLRREKSGYLQSINTLNSEINNNINRINGYKSAIIEHGENIERYKKLIVEAEQGIEEAKKRVFKSNEEEIKKQITGIELEISEKDVEIDDIKNKIFDTEQWVHRFKKFRSHLANESLEIIQGYANMYLEKMGSNLSLQLEGYKELKSGQIREKITPIVLRDGEIEGSGSYKNYSLGEKSRIDVCASILAFQELINNSCETGGLNLLFIDEVLSGVDSLGLELIIKELDTLQKPCYVVSHTTHESVPDNVITIKKTNKISNFV